MLICLHRCYSLAMAGILLHEPSHACGVLLAAVCKVAHGFLCVLAPASWSTSAHHHSTPATHTCTALPAACHQHFLRRLPQFLLPGHASRSSMLVTCHACAFQLHASACYIFVDDQELACAGISRGVYVLLGELHVGHPQPWRKTCRFKMRCGDLWLQQTGAMYD